MKRAGFKAKQGQFLLIMGDFNKNDFNLVTEHSDLEQAIHERNRRQRVEDTYNTGLSFLIINDQGRIVGVKVFM